MRMQLPAPDRTTLKNAPLQLVVCQVRFDEADTPSTRKAARRFFDKLGGTNGAFPKFSQIHTQHVTINAQAALGEQPATMQQRGWKFSNADGSMSVSLFPDSLALETRAYRCWDEFAPQLELALTVLVDEVDPAIEQRLGLRFVNLIVVDDLDGEDLSAYIAPELLAPAGHRILGPGLVAALHRVLLDLGDDLRCLFNYGHAAELKAADRPGYVLDLDVFRERSAPFSAADVYKAAEVMNDRAVSLFQQAVTPKLLTILGSDEELGLQEKQERRP